MGEKNNTRSSEGGRGVMGQEKITGDRAAASNLPPLTKPELPDSKRPEGASPRADAAADAFDSLPHLQASHVADKKLASGTALMLEFPDGRRFQVRASLEGGSSKTAYDTRRAGNLRRGRYVDLQTVVKDNPGLKGSMTRQDIVKELALTRRYLDPGAVAGVTQDGAALHSHLITEKLPVAAQDAVRAAAPDGRQKVTTKILRDVARKLAVMHHDGKAHLDVKPDNIRLNRRGVALLIDFNSVGDAADTPAWRPGNRSFRAPAFLLGNADRNLEVDVHSLGVTGLTLLVGHRGSPFHDFGAIGTMERLQPGLDALRERPHEAFTGASIDALCAGHEGLRAFLHSAHQAAPALTETIVRDMLGSHARPAAEVARRLDALVRSGRVPRLLGTVARTLKYRP